MHLNFSPEEQAFRAEVRAFLAAELPEEIRDKVRSGGRLEKDDMLRWQRILYRRGWGAGMGPGRFGGADWRVFQQHIFAAERATASHPPQIPFTARIDVQIV